MLHLCFSYCIDPKKRLGSVVRQVPVVPLLYYILLESAYHRSFELSKAKALFRSVVHDNYRSLL